MIQHRPTSSPVTENNSGHYENQCVGKNRIFMNLSKVQVPPNLQGSIPPCTKPFWRLAVHESTGLAFDQFHKTPLCEQLHKWQQADRNVDIIRCDNAGENKWLERRLRSSAWKIGYISFEYIAARIPEQNSVVEKKFDILFYRGIAMMIGANVSLQNHYLLCREALDTQIKLDDLTIFTIDGKTATRSQIC